MTGPVDGVPEGQAEQPTADRPTEEQPTADPLTEDRLTRVLGADGLDILELALLGALAPGHALAALGVVPGAGGLVLADVENTPLAAVHPGGPAGPVIAALRPFARATGPAWDPALRRTPADVLAALAKTGPGPHGGRALVADDVPTRVDLQALARARADGPGILLAILVGRRPDDRRRARPAGVVRAWRDALAAVAGGSPGIVPVVVPWPVTAQDVGLEPGAVLAAYGATACERIDDGRGPVEREDLDRLATSDEQEVHRLYPEASAAEILRARRTSGSRGAVVFLTGLSGSGKSTIARALAAELEDRDGRLVTLLDGDEVRQHLSRGLGFDAESRAINIDRIAYVASLVAAHGGIAVAAPIAPFDAGRRAARAMAEPHGAFVLVHVATPLDVCEARDRKGLYAQARAGEIPEFTGISSPYEPPIDAEVVIDTTATEVDAAVAAILAALDRLEAAGGIAG